MEKKTEVLNCRTVQAAASLLAVIGSIVPAFADQISEQIKGGMSNVYSIITAVVLPIAAVALAISAIKMIGGDTRSGEATKQNMIRIVIAVAIVFLAPFLIETISTWFTGTTSTVFN